MGRGHHVELEAKEEIKSIIEQEPAEVCYICGRGGKLQKHHIFGGNPNRGHSENYGLTVHLCTECHTEGKEAVHKDAEIMEALHKIGQAAFERTHTREEFVAIFGKNYLETLPTNAPAAEPEWGFIWIAVDN